MSIMFLIYQLSYVDNKTIVTGFNQIGRNYKSLNLWLYNVNN